VSISALLRRYLAPGFRPPDWCMLVYRDYRRYRAADESLLTAIFLTQGFWASCVYRMSRALVGQKRGVLHTLARIMTAAMQKAVEIVTGILIPRECDIGEGLYIGHFGTIIFPSGGRIGCNCNIAQIVTIGIAGSGENKGVPTIGERVFIGAHSVVVGKITIGDDAMICAGSVVTRSVPPRAVVMGNPAKVVSYKGSFEYVVYDGMEQDPERRASLECARSEFQKEPVRSLQGIAKFTTGGLNAGSSTD
jgi:serine O-acetyltransferase